VLSPPDIAPWLAAVPMHSFGSHFIFSLTFAEQNAFAEDFFAGRLDSNRAEEGLAHYGVRYIVAPENTRLELSGYSEPGVIGKWRVFENPRNRMKQYSWRRFS